MNRILDRYLNGKTLARWQRAGQSAGDAALPDLRNQRDQARHLNLALNRFLKKADGRLTRPLVGSVQFPKPLGTDWSWRPDIWREPLNRTGLASAPRKAKMDGQVTLFHDCNLAEISLHQIRNRSDRDLAPFGLALEIFNFAGSFVSLSVELPADVARDLSRQHLMRVDAAITAERSTEVYTRLNIQHGPNTEQVLRGLDVSDRSSSVDFDLAHLQLNERRIEKLWLDVIIQDPAMNRIDLRDLTFCRHHRADM